MKKKIFIGSVMVGFLLVGVLLFFNFQLVTIDGPSMKPFLSDQETFIIKKHVSKKDINRFDVVLLNLKSNKQYRNDYFVKRVYGLPGETVELKNGAVFINGKKIDDPYPLEKKNRLPVYEKKITLGKDEYYVLGDNRNNSNDSRNSKFGAVKFDEIVGKYTFSFK